MGSFFQEMFRLLGGNIASLSDPDELRHGCSGTLEQAVEHVVDKTDPRLRALPGYNRRLREPVTAAIRYIDGLVESVPGAILCCRSAFTTNPSVNAFFVSPQHIQEVFSQNAEVRALFDANPDVSEGWALLCMRREERRQPGMALVGDSVRSDVMQTTVSFTDHQIIAPGASELDARRSLKCCILDGLLAYIRSRLNAAKTRSVELETRIKSLRARSQQSNRPIDDAASDESLPHQIESLEQELAQQDLRLASLGDHLTFLADVMGNPQQYLSSCTCSIRLSRLGVKLEDETLDSGYELPLSEIQIGSQQPRVGALVRFPRSELLPRQDFLEKADLFLAL